jgi:hypothetical protein
MSLAHFVLQRKCLCFSVVHWANSISMVGHMKWYIVGNCFTCFVHHIMLNYIILTDRNVFFLIIYKFEVKHILNDSSKRQHANSYKSCMHRFKIKFIVLGYHVVVSIQMQLRSLVSECLFLSLSVLRYFHNELIQDSVSVFTTNF